MPQLPSVPKKFFFKGQIAHLLLLIALLVGAFLLVDLKRLGESRFLGVGTHFWIVTSLAVPIVHQVYVWLAWRSELCFGAITNRLGSRAFVIYRIVFFVLFLARPVSLILLTLADHDSFEMSIPSRLVICVVLSIPAAYTLYSVARYFGLEQVVIDSIHVVISHDDADALGHLDVLNDAA